MERLAMLYRAAQFYAHHCHLVAKGPTFKSDHDWLGELYAEYEGSFDKLMEQMIGLGDKPDCHAILKDAADVANEMECPNDNTEGFRVLLNFETQFTEEIASLMKKEKRDGTQNLLQDLATDSDQRTYMIGRRVG